MNSIRRVTKPTLDAIEEILRAREPVLVLDALDSWPALKNWSPAYFRKQASDLTVACEVHPDGNYFNSWENDAAPRIDMISFANALDRVLSPEGRERYYAMMTIAEETCPTLAADVPKLEFLASRPLRRAAFVGMDADSPLHFHHSDQVLLSQIFGTKRLKFYPPGKLKDFYCRGILRGYSHHSRVNFTEGELRRFPRFQAIPEFEVTLEPGQAIFIPVHWWHQVHSSGPSAAVQIAWPSRLREQFLPSPGIRSLLAVAVDSLIAPHRYAESRRT